MHCRGWYPRRSRERQQRHRGVHPSQHRDRFPIQKMGVRTLDCLLNHWLWELTVTSELPIALAAAWKLSKVFPVAGALILPTIPRPQCVTCLQWNQMAEQRKEGKSVNGDQFTPLSNVCLSEYTQEAVTHVVCR